MGLGVRVSSWAQKAADFQRLFSFIISQGGGAITPLFQIERPFRAGSLMRLFE